MFNTKYIFLILASILTFGCADNGSAPVEDAGMLFSDSFVVLDSGLDFDVVVDPDAGTLDGDTGVVVTDDAGTDDVGVVADLGTDSNVETDVGLPDSGPVDLGADSGPIDVGVEFPPGDTIYYVVIPDTSWSSLEDAQALCASYGGKAPVFSLDELADSAAQRNEFETVVNLGLLQPIQASACAYPVNDSQFSCATYCGSLPVTERFACNNNCPTGSVTTQCNYLRAFPEANSKIVYNISYTPTTVGLQLVNRRMTCMQNTSNPCRYSYSVGSTAPNHAANLLCAIPESAGFVTGNVDFPEFAHVVSDFFTSQNAL